MSNPSSLSNLPSLPIPTLPDPDRRARILDACAQLAPLFRSHAEERHVPGLAYGVVVDGELIFSEGLGVRNVAADAPVDADTVFRIASMTKSFAALAILQLRDAGKLRLDEAAATYVSELANWRYPTTDTQPITVRHLLSMSAGFPQDDPWADRQLYRSDAAMRQFYAAGVSWSNPPGITFEYSNYGYMLLGRIITNVSGIPAIDYISQTILQPLGMDATVWNATDVPSERLALGYRWEDAQWKAEALLPAGGDVATFAGLFTSVRDLARWVGLFQSAWPPRHESEQGPLARSSLREMQQIWRTYDPTVSVPALGAQPEISAGGYGYGLSIQHNGKWAGVGHGGGLPGFGSHMRWAPAYGVGVVSVANLTYAAVSHPCSKALEMLIETTQVKSYTLPIAPALTAARADLLRLVKTWDDALADTLFADNFFLDLDVAHRQQEFAELQETHGRLTPDGPFVVENWLRGGWRMTGERGWCHFFITLSPTVPPRIQDLEIESTLPPSATLQAGATALAALTAEPHQPTLAALCAAGVDQAQLWDQVRLANILCGACAVGEVTGGDGATWAGFHFVGSKGQAAVRITITADGKLADADFQPMPRT